MTENIGWLKLVRSADVYKAGVLAGHLNRTSRGSVAFSYAPAYIAAGTGIGRQPCIMGYKKRLAVGKIRI